MVQEYTRITGDKVDRFRLTRQDRSEILIGGHHGGMEIKGMGESWI